MDSMSLDPIPGTASEAGRVCNTFSHSEFQRIRSPDWMSGIL